VRTERAASFARVADAYERARPGYPADAVLWLAGETPCDVVDLGAGTGKLTRSLAALGHHVVAVEPLAEMLEQLPDASIDVVACAQAFHWFDQEAALSEIARVLRPGGRIALVWNVRDERVPWVSELSDAMVGRTGVDRGASEPIERSGLYGEVERARFEHTQDVDREALRALVLSRSYCAVLPEEERAPILGRVDAVFDAYARDGLLTLPYVVECFRAALR